MAIERTLSILKPDITRRNLTGKINEKIESSALRIIAQKRLWLTLPQAQAFYGVHATRAFFNDLCAFMTSGPVVVQVLEGENAIAKYRDVMGATNPANADPGTIRREFAESIEANSVHGSDSLETSFAEIKFFFSDIEIIG
jgi:nucleoside-diphosphate kinase